ncbi:MAG TPA: maleylpyruvate isomerase family mycothiol-dependent enzyme [Actinotalea sp.]|nr:maleylpyruvate isomerase family mycothiol-dependent enzyme [Actinotalea sp.]
MIPADVDVARESLEWTHERLRTVLEGLTDAQVAEPSRLPGWSRGHVLAHLAGLGQAVLRQLEAVLAGQDPQPLYDGGRVARDAAISAGAGAPAVEHVERVDAVIDRLEGAMDLLDEDSLARRTGYHGLPAAAVVLLWWREASIHLTDLDLGAEHTLWGAALREHLVVYLAPRVPAGVRLDLDPTDVDEPRRLGDGEHVRLTGAANDLVGWLAGRAPLAPIHAEQGGHPVPLPTLGPWP